MVYLSASRLLRLFAMALFMVSVAISAQRAPTVIGSDGMPMDSSPDYPLYIIDSWSAPYHDDLDELFVLLANQPADRGFAPAISALQRWRDRYYAEGFLRYQELTGRSEPGPVSEANRGVEEARLAIELLSAAEWEREFFLEVFDRIAGAMVLLRPDITPNSRFWHSFRSPGQHALDDAAGFFILARAAGIEVLADTLRDGSYPSAFIDALLSAPPGRQFAGFMSDPVDLIFREAPGSEALRADDAVLCYNRLIRASFLEEIRSGPDARWAAYIDDLRRIEENLVQTLPANVSGAELQRQLFLPDGQLSDQYWALLSLLENPFFLDDPDRIAQVESVYLSLLQTLRSDVPEIRRIFAAVSRQSSDAPEFSLAPLGQLRKYAIALYEGGEGIDLPANWSVITRGVSLADEADYWHLLSGLYPVDVRDMPDDFDSLDEAARQLLLMIKAAEELDEALQQIQPQDPAVPSLLTLRKLILFDDISRTLGDEISSSLPLELRGWLNLGEMILNQALVPEDIDLLFAWEQMGRSSGDPQAAQQVILELRRLILENESVTENGESSEDPI
jgi:hypothetical protein